MLLGFKCLVLVCGLLLFAISSSAIISLRKVDLVDLLTLFSWFCVYVFMSMCLMSLPCDAMVSL